MLRDRAAQSPSCGPVCASEEMRPARRPRSQMSSNVVWRATPPPVLTNRAARRVGGDCGKQGKGVAKAAHAGRAAQRLKFGLDLGSRSNLRRVVVVIVHVESGAEVGQREAQERAERDRAASMENKKAAGAGAAKAAAMACGSRHHPQCNVAAKSQAGRKIGQLCWGRESGRSRAALTSWRCLPAWRDTCRHGCRQEPTPQPPDSCC